MSERQIEHLSDNCYNSDRECQRIYKNVIQAMYNFYSYTNAYIGLGTLLEQTSRLTLFQSIADSANYIRQIKCDVLMTSH